MTIENKVSAHEGLGLVENSLKEIWLEIGGSCHLRCSYCFANSGGIDCSKDNMSRYTLDNVLQEFQVMGGERLGLVGAGEPFHPRNIEDTFHVLDVMDKAAIKTTLFTTGDLITDATIDKLEQYKNMVLLVKYNSSNPELQDKLVGSKGYTERRSVALDKLMRRGFNDGKRLGVVTSFFEENADEMIPLLRYARNNNLILDIDTPIPRGRGSTCDREAIAKLVKPLIEEMARIDREEYGNVWEPHCTYIASPPCTRFSQHLYIKKDGVVIPCVGSPGVILGNVKTESLKDIWNKDITRIIRGHNYTGKCTTCKNYQEKKCFSCLGRSTEDLSTEQLQRDGCIKTIGCFQYKQN